MGNDNDNNNNNSWTCCNDQQTLFLLLYLAFSLLCLLFLRTPLAKPLRLVATVFHELSHATACWLTGGTVHKIHVYHDNEGGVTQYTGGWRWCIVPAGYVGCSVWAMALVTLSGGRRTATAAAVGLVLAWTGSLWYSPNAALVVWNLGYAAVTVGVLVVEWCWYTPLVSFCVLGLGVSVGLVAVVDIYHDTIAVRHVIPGSDADACHKEIWLCRCATPRCIGVQWIGMAVACQCLGIWMALVQMSNGCEDQGWWECWYRAASNSDGGNGDDGGWWWDGIGDFDFDGFWRNTNIMNNNNNEP